MQHKILVYINDKIKKENVECNAGNSGNVSLRFSL